MADAIEHRDAGTDHEEHSHPGPWTYIIIAFILTAITALEVAIFYIPALAGVIVPLLLVLSAGKFVLVVLFYMHLKMDSRVFSTVFFAPMALAVFLVVSLFLLFRVVPQG